jgi:hypothetical protein
MYEAMGSVSGNLLTTSVGRSLGPGRDACHSKVQHWLADDANQTTTKLGGEWAARIIYIYVRLQT